VLSSILAGIALAAQDRNSVQVPGGLGFAEFKGYEDWQVIAASHNGDEIAIIFGNPAMIEAYKSGIPGNGKPFPDGARMAKIHWMAKKDEAQPGEPVVPGALRDRCSGRLAPEAARHRPDRLPNKRATNLNAYARCDSSLLELFRWSPLWCAVAQRHTEFSLQLSDLSQKNELIDPYATSKADLILRARNDQCPRARKRFTYVPEPYLLNYS
jgi:hypothetical protein